MHFKHIFEKVKIWSDFNPLSKAHHNHILEEKTTNFQKAITRDAKITFWDRQIQFYFEEAFFSLIKYVIPSWTNVDGVCFLSDAQVKCEIQRVETRKGWCPRTGRGQRLMIRIAVNEDIVLATCQDKYSE